jgi:hypothetical protein
MAKASSKSKSKSSAIDRHAKMLAVALGKGQLPPLTLEIDIFLDECPKEIFAAFEGVVRHMPPGGKNEPLAVGYLFLLQGLLERLRFRSERGYDDAIELIAKFQSEVAGQALAGRIDGDVLAYVSGALAQAKIPASPDLIAVSAELGLGDEDDDEDMLPADVEASLEAMLDECGDDPFVLVGAFAQAAHTLPEEAKTAVAVSFAGAERAEARAAAVLFLLDASAVVRRETAAALSEVAASLAPADLRRLIAMRNWRPEGERAELDGIIHKARAAGIACAPWEKGAADRLRASPVDGSMAQAFLLTSPAGRSRKRMSSILTKHGIADAWCGEPETQRQIAAAIDASGGDVPMLEVSRGYLDRMVSHHLALTIAKGETPPIGLLRIAEIIGGAEWQPSLLDFREELAALIADLPAGRLTPEEVDTALADSDTLFDLDGIEQSWFEDDAEVAEIVDDALDRDDETLVRLLLQGVLDQRRNKWAELFVQIAFWMREADAEYPSWADLTVVARALWEGRDLAEIGLMRTIAEQTIDVMADEQNR